jgi:hypothetical protein
MVAMGMGGPRKRAARLLAPFIVVIASPALAQDCPPGATQVGQERVGNKIRVFCKCSSSHGVRGQQCVLKFPEVDPASTISPKHVAFIKEELATLAARRDRLRRQLENIDKLRAQQDQYLREMGELRQQLIFDSAGHILRIAGTPELLAGIKGLSAADAETVARTTATLRAAFDAVANAQAGPDRERAREKAISASATAASQLAAMALPAPYGQPLSRAIATSGEIAKAATANRDPGKPLLTRVATRLDDLAAVYGTIDRRVGAMRAGVHTVGSAIVLWNIRHDRESIVEALVSSQRAKLAASQRLAATEGMIAFYETELKKVGQ